MGVTLTNKPINTTYQGLVKFSDNLAATPVYKTLTDGFGNDLGISVSTEGVKGKKVYTEQTIQELNADLNSVCPSKEWVLNALSTNLYVDITLTKEQLKTLGTTKVVIVSAQGVDEVIVPLSIVYSWNYNGVPFDSNDIATGPDGNEVTLVPSATVGGTSNELVSKNVSSFVERNTDYVVSGVDSVATGDATLQISMTYRVSTMHTVV